MNPDIDITSTDGAGDASKSKGAFLEALGLDEATLLGEANEAPPTSREERDPDDGLVLSSQPDDLRFSLPGTAPRRGFHVTGSIKVQRPAVASITLPVETSDDPEPAESPETPVSPNEKAGIPELEAKNPEETLHLHCPQCRGALVLKRRHLGVEGACVWCHVPLVAAEAPEAGRIRIFPVLVAGSSPLLPPPAPAREEENSDRPTPHPASEQGTGFQMTALETKAGAAAKPAEAEAPISSGFASGFSEPFPGTVESAPAISTQSSPTPVAEPGLSESPTPGFSGFVPAETKPAPAPETSQAVGPQAFPGGFVLPATVEPTSPAADLPTPETDKLAISATPDLDDLYSVGGFLGNNGPAPSTPATTSAAPSPSPGFATDFAEPAPSSGFSEPSPWGPPTLAPATPPSTPTRGREESTPAAVGFSSMDSPDDAPPAAIPDGFGTASGKEEAKAPGPSWEEAFGAPSPASSPSGFSIPEASAIPMDRNALSSHQMDAVSENAGSAVAKEPESKWMAPPREPDLSSSFAPPAHGFSTGSSELFGESDDAPVLFGDPGFGPPMPWDDKNPDDAPASLDPVEEKTARTGTAETSGLGESLFGSPKAASNLFGPSPEALPELPAPVETVETVDAPVSSPTPAPLPVSPVVTHAPGVMKPKRKVRKGFLILMVVIVGFAAGAALASFVLPIEEYVNAARGFMEKTFNLPATRTQMSSLPSALESLPSAVPVPAQADRP